MNFEKNPEDEKQYFSGATNRIIRYWFYLENGLSIINEFRNLFLGIIAVYITLKLTNPIWMIVMIVPSLIFLTIVGYFMVHKVAKVKEWVAMRFSTHFGIKNFDYTKGNHELLTEIRDSLQKNKDSVVK